MKALEGVRRLNITLTLFLPTLQSVKPCLHPYIYLSVCFQLFLLQDFVNIFIEF